MINVLRNQNKVLPLHQETKTHRGMAQNLYTVEWLDDYGVAYDTIEDLTFKQMVHYRQEAKYMRLKIRVTKQK